MRLGMGEVLIILVVVLLVFGPNKLPQLGDSLGKGLRSFKQALNHDEATGDRVNARAGEATAAGADPTNAANEGYSGIGASRSQ